MKKTFAAPRGTRDFLPDEASKRKFIESKMRYVLELFGFQEIQTPTFEEFDLFAARSGEEIREGMFTFVADEKEYALRPEYTAAVARLITTGKITLPKPYELYYIGPCFRYERPQSGRYREFTQVGVELIGSALPIADAKVIAMATAALNHLGLKNYKLKVGNVGVFRDLLQSKGFDYDTQTRIIRGLNGAIELHEKLDAISEKKSIDDEDLEYVKNKINELYELQEKVNYSGEFEVTPVTKVDRNNFKELVERLPKILEETNKLVWSRDFKLDVEFITLLLSVANMRGSRKDVELTAKKLLADTAAAKPVQELFDVLDWLERFGVKDYAVVLGVARGLDFYTGTVFEIDCPLLGAQKQICGGGRYDKLIEEFGGPKMPATGFGFGFDRTILALEQSGIAIPIQSKAQVFVAATNDAVRPRAVEIAQTLRVENFRVCEDLLGLDFKRQLESANKLKMDYVVIVGSKELESNSVSVKDMRKQTQSNVSISDISSVLK